MADWAGGHGAGGAADALYRLINQKNLEREMAQREQAMKDEREARAQDRQLRADAQRAGERAFAIERGERAREKYEDRLQRDVERKTEVEERQKDREARRLEREEEVRRRERERQEDREFQATERAKDRAIYGRRDGSERTVQVRYTDPDTGEEVVEFMTADEARQRGKMRAPGTRGQQVMREKLADLFEAERMANDILKRGAEAKWRGIGPLAGRIAAVQGATGALRDPTVLRLHQDIGNLFSLISHERFGAALTANEIRRAKAFLPQKTDTPAVLENKLQGLIEFARSKRENMGGLIPEAERRLRGGGMMTSRGQIVDAGGGEAPAAQEFDWVPGRGLVPRGGQ